MFGQPFFGRLCPCRRGGNGPLSSAGDAAHHRRARPSLLHGWARDYFFALALSMDLYVWYGTIPTTIGIARYVSYGARLHCTDGRRTDEMEMNNCLRHHCP